MGVKAGWQGRVCEDFEVGEIYQHPLGRTITQTDMKTLLIGDIHGCFAELQDLLDKAGLAAQDQVIALGDVVDRGPETPQVAAFFRQQPHALTLMGNHERKHIRWARGEVRPASSQIISRGQFGEAYSDALAWMRTLPIYLELPEAILVHGYLEPGLPLEAQAETVVCGTMGGEHRLASHYARPWYELYAGPKPVVVGHHDYLRNGQAFVYQERVFGLDTSCVHGKSLTGLILPDFKLVSAPSRGDHWRQISGEYKQANKTNRLSPEPRRPKAAVRWTEEDEVALQAILAHVVAENERLMAELRQQPGFDELPPRRQAVAYSGLIGDTPLAALLHLARRGELVHDLARTILGEPGKAKNLKIDLGL